MLTSAETWLNPETLFLSVDCTTLIVVFVFRHGSLSDQLQLLDVFLKYLNPAIITLPLVVSILKLVKLDVLHRLQ